MTSMPYDSNNVFAKILRGELPSVKIFEDSHTLAFMDLMPSAEGHTLVIPKESAETIFDLSRTGAAALMATTQIVADAVRKALNCEGLMLVQLNGATAGQSIAHVHFHIGPRSEGLDLRLHGRSKADPQVLEAIAARIRAQL
ncbi:MAG TPA: HIT family protein [Rhizomicrobium sp.]|nr:HIT family protein [Rhizomicrobium sp.]